MSSKLIILAVKDECDTSIARTPEFLYVLIMILQDVHPACVYVEKYIYIRMKLQNSRSLRESICGK